MRAPAFDPLEIVRFVEQARPWRPDVLLPFIVTGEEHKNVFDCIQFDPVGYEYINKFERKLEGIVGMPALAVSSGTAALHLALLACGVDPGDEVIVPAMMFAGCAAAVRYCGATPYFVDVESNGCIDIGQLDRIQSKNVSAVIAVDFLGRPAASLELKEWCEYQGWWLIEDGASALGTKGIGQYADVLTLSFNCNKIVTTGGGGALLSRDAELLARACHLATTAKISDKYHFVHDTAGYNYRMPNVCAALGLGQLDRLWTIVEKKAILHGRYHGHMPDIMNCWLNTVQVPHGYRDRTMHVLDKSGYACRALYTPLHTLAPYRGCPRIADLSISERLFDTTICLPSGVEP